MDSPIPKLGVGPFTTQTFNQIFWDEILTSVLLLNDPQSANVLDNSSYILQLIQEISMADNHEEYFGDSTIKDFFLSTFLPSIAKELVQYESNLDNNNTANEFINEFLHQLTILCARGLKEDYTGFVELICLIMRSETCYQLPESYKSNIISEDKVLYAVSEQHSAIAIVSLINTFGSHGGFSFICDRISDTQKLMPVSYMSMLFSMIGNICHLFHTGFAREYIQSLQEAVYMNISCTAAFNIARMEKELISSVALLLAKIYPPLEAAEKQNYLKLKLCERYFEDFSVQSKLQGLEMLSQVIKNKLLESYILCSSDIFSDIISAFLDKNDIFDKLYSIDVYPTLVAESGWIFQYMLRENRITDKHLEIMWDSTRSYDTDIQFAVYGLFSAQVSHLQVQHMEYILAQILEIPLEETTEKEIDLVIKFAKTNCHSHLLHKQIWNFYWMRVLLDFDIKDVRWVSFQQLVDIITMNHLKYKDEIYEMINKNILNLHKKSLGLSVMQQIRKLINHFPEYTQSKCLSDLCNEYGILSQVIEDLRNSKKELQAEILEIGVPTKKQSNSLSPQRTYLSYISQRFDFLNFIVDIIKHATGILTCKFLYDLWEITVVNGLIQHERRLGFQLFKKIAELASVSFDKNEFLEFYRKTMLFREFQACNGLEVTSIGPQCFKSFFVMVNLTFNNLTEIPYQTDSCCLTHQLSRSKSRYYRLQVSPNQLEGISEFWKFAVYLKGSSDQTGMYSWLWKMYTSNNHHHLFPDMCYLTFKEALRDPLSPDLRNQWEKYQCIIKEVIVASEKDGFGKLQSHLGLLKGETVCVKCSSYDSKIELEIDSGKSLLELRALIAEKLNIKWDQLVISKDKDPKIVVPQSDNIRTLQELQFLDKQMLFLTETKVPFVPYCNLTEINGTLAPKVHQIVLELFEDFSDNGKISPEQLSACSGSFLPRNQVRIGKMFSVFNVNRDDYLSKDDFIEYWTHYCKTDSSFVYNNLSKHGYRQDFNKVNKVGQLQGHERTLPRYLISANNEHFQLLYSLLDCGDSQISNQAWELVSQLPTNIKLMEDIVMLKGVKDVADTQKKQAWDALFQAKSEYKLQYALICVMSLIDNTFKPEKSNSLLREGLLNWKQDFYTHGGPLYLIEIYNVLSKENPGKMSRDHKRIMSLILKITSNYLPFEPVCFTPDGRVSCLKKLLVSLIDIRQGVLEGKDIFSEHANVITDIKRMRLKTNSKNEEAQAISIFSKANMKEFMDGVIKLSSHLLAEKSFDTEDLMIARSSICLLRGLIFYIESA